MEKREKERNKRNKEEERKENECPLRRAVRAMPLDKNASHWKGARMWITKNALQSNIPIFRTLKNILANCKEKEVANDDAIKIVKAESTVIRGKRKKFKKVGEIV